MNIKLEIMFKARLENELYIDSITIEKIKNIRKNVFNEFKEKINGFQDVNCKIMKGYTAFDRKTEIRKEKYNIELFIEFKLNNFKIEKNEEYFKIKTDNEHINPESYYKLITANISNLNYNPHTNTIKKPEDNIILNIIPCIYIPGEYYLIPATLYSSKKFKNQYYGKIKKDPNRIKDIILITKYCIHCRCFYNPKIDYFIENTIVKYYNENESKECIYLDFYEVLNYIHKNRGDKIGHEENQYGTECFAGA